MSLYNFTNKNWILDPTPLLEKHVIFWGNLQDKPYGYILIKTQAIRKTST